MTLVFKRSSIIIYVDVGTIVLEFLYQKLYEILQMKQLA